MSTLVALISKVIPSLEFHHLSFPVRFLRQGSRMIAIRPKKVETVSKSKGQSPPIGHRQRTVRPYYDEEEVDENDYIAQRISSYGSKYSAFESEREKTKELLKLASFVKSKTLENRYFKQPKKPNLLTWACKEQIRHLHTMDPDMWSCEALAETFPVSETSVKKILNSRVRLHRLVDVMEHDLFVKRNWGEIHSSLLSKSLNILTEEEMADVVRGIGNEDNLMHIFPLKEERMPKQLSVTVMPKKLGTFSSIVKDELEKKDLENRMLFSKHQQQLEHLKETVMKIRDILLDSNPKESTNPKTKIDAATEPLPSRTSDTSGRKGHAPFELSVASNSKNSKFSSYIVDGCVYDEDGDFLYRIPS